MAEDWGQDPEAIEETTSERKIARWLALNAARGEAMKQKAKKPIQTTEPGVNVRKIF